MSTYYERNKEHLKALAKKYRAAHLEKCKAYAAAYFQKVTKSKRQTVGRKMNKPESKKDYTIKTTIKYKEPVPKTPKAPKVRKPAAPKPVIERSGVLTFD